MGRVDCGVILTLGHLSFFSFIQDSDLNPNLYHTAEKGGGFPK